MMQPRLASSVLVSGLIRTAEAQGGVGAVLAKGDAQAGAVAVILAERGVKRRFLSGRSGRMANIAGPIPAAALNETRKDSRIWSPGGGGPIPIYGWWNWISRQPNGSPMK